MAKILIVDDDVLLLQALVRLFRGKGHAVVSATGCDDALAVVVAGSMPDLVLTDCDMGPDGGGFELLRRLHAAGYRGPSVMCTGLLTPERVGAAKAAGFVACVAKPLDVDAVLRAVAA